MGLLALLTVAGVVAWVLAGGDRGDPGSGDGVVSLPSAPDGRTASGAPDASSGSTAWSRTHPDGPVVVTRDHVVVQHSAGPAAEGRRTLVVLDRATGATLVETERDWTSWHPLAAAGRRVLLAVDDRELVLLDQVDGQVSVQRLGGWATAEEPLPGARHRLRRAFLVPSGAYLQAGSSMVALDIHADEDADGSRIAQRWRWSDQHVLSTGLTDEGPYVVVVDGVVALDPATGSVRWRRTLVTFNNRSNVVHRGVLVIADDEGSVTALDTRTGDVRWQRSPGGGFTSQLAPAEETVVGVAATGQVTAYDVKTGAVVWQLRRPEARLEHAVTGADSVVLTGTVRQGPAIVVNLADDGRQRWAHSVPSIEDVGLGRGLVVVGEGDGATAFDALTGAHRWSVALGGPTEVVDIGANVILATPDRVVAVPLDGARTLPAAPR